MKVAYDGSTALALGEAFQPDVAVLDTKPVDPALLNDLLAEAGSK